MTYKTLPYCVTCKAWDKPMHNNSTHKHKNITSVSLMCRDCRREKQKRYYEANKEKCRAIIYKSMGKHSHKQSARAKVRYALQIGTLTKPEQCSECSDSGCRLEAHHEDYSKPLDVVWLCTACHAKADKQLKANENSKV